MRKCIGVQHNNRTWVVTYTSATDFTMLDSNQNRLNSSAIPVQDRATISALYNLCPDIPSSEVGGLRLFNRTVTKKRVAAAIGAAAALGAGLYYFS